MFWEFGLPPRVSEPQTKKGARRIKSERFNLNLKSRPTCSAEHNFNSTSNPKEK